MPSEKRDSNQVIKYQVFISSTYVDLKEERQEVVDTILKKYHFPIGMEMFSADDKQQWEIIKNTIDTSDIYILMIGHRYGSTTGGRKSISFTEKEFDYAVKMKKEKGLKILCFIRERKVELDPSKIEDNHINKEKLSKFITKVKNGGFLVKFWKTKEDLGKEIAVALPNSVGDLGSIGARGWVRRDLSNVQMDDLVKIDAIKKFMFLTAVDFDTENDDTETYTIDKYGNCTIERNRIQNCKSDLTHSYTQYVSDKVANKSQVLEIVDLAAGKRLSHLLHMNEDSTFGFFVLFDKPLKKGETIHYKSRVLVQNYLSNLIDNGRGSIHYLPFTKTSFLNKKDVFIFPNIDKFQKLSVILNHKRPNEILNEKIKFKLIGGNKVYTIDYGPVGPGSEIKVDFKLK